MILAVLSASMVQRTFQMFSEIPLAGVSVPKTDSLTGEHLLSGSFRDSWEKYFDFTAGFRTWMVRSHNQAMYSLFHLSANPTLVVGKEHYLYGDIYLSAYTGQGFTSESAMKRQLFRLNQISRMLQSRGIVFLIVIAPNKARLFPQNIPDHILRHRTFSWYESFIKETARYPDIQVLDFNAYFTHLLDTVSYPLIPKNGIHWSNFTCQTIVPDTLTRLICAMKGIPVPPLPTPYVYYSDTLLVPDYDLYELLNLWSVQPDEAIPYARYDPGQIPVIPLRILTIGDSFFWNLYAHYPWKALYPVNDFWFYGTQRYPVHKFRDPEELTAEQIGSELLEHDVVILMVAEINLGTLMDFPDHACAWLGIQPAPTP